MLAPPADGGEQHVPPGARQPLWRIHVPHDCALGMSPVASLSGVMKMGNRAGPCLHPNRHFENSWNNSELFDLLGHRLNICCDVPTPFFTHMHVSADDRGGRSRRRRPGDNLPGQRTGGARVQHMGVSHRCECVHRPRQQAETPLHRFILERRRSRCAALSGTYKHHELFLLKKLSICTSPHTVQLPMDRYVLSRLG